MSLANMLGGFVGGLHINDTIPESVMVLKYPNRPSSGNHALRRAVRCGKLL